MAGAASLMTTAVMADDDFEGSIKMSLFESEHKAMREVKISMINAIKAAKAKASGRVIKAKLDEEDHYLIYKIKLVSDKGEKTEVIVDPVSAKVLKIDKDD